MALDTTTKINLDFECTLCGHEFNALTTSFFTSTDRKDGVELKQVKAKCGGCGKWSYYPHEVTDIARHTGRAQVPTFRSGEFGRMRMDALPSDFADVINNSNDKLAEKGYEVGEEDGED
jgi:hypothetical protein